MDEHAKRIRFERMQGECLFGEMVTVIKDYVHQYFLLYHKVPGLDEVLVDADYIGTSLHLFLEEIRKVWPEAAFHVVYRIRQLLQVAQIEYEGEKSA
jgi:hypothetical protein